MEAEASFVPCQPVSMIPTGKRDLFGDPAQDGGSHVSKSWQEHRGQLLTSVPSQLTRQWVP